MKLLLLIHRLPCPPDRGSKQRVARLLHGLAARHDLWCAGLLDGDARSTSSPEARASLEALRSVCRDVAAVPLRRGRAGVRALGALLGGGTCTEGYFASSVLRRQVTAWSKAVGFDAVLAFSSSMAPLALTVPAARRVLDLDDLDSEKWDELASATRGPMSWVYRTEARRLARRERDWLATFDASVFVNAREAARVPEALRSRVHVIPAGVPIDVPGPEGRDEADRAVTALPAEPVVGFVGAMDYRPNVDAVLWFAEAIWPRVRESRPDAEWWIVGRSPVRAVRRLHGAHGTRVTGAVPLVGPYLERMRISVAPVRQSRGVQIKVLSAMAAGRPCVVTPFVAEGLSARPGRDLLVASDAAQFAARVVELLNDDELALRLARAGQTHVQREVGAAERRGLEHLERLLAGPVASRLTRDTLSLQPSMVRSA